MSKTTRASPGSPAVEPCRKGPMSRTGGGTGLGALAVSAVVLMVVAAMGLVAG